ncbi:acyl-CoA dehydrogenase family protein [Actinosynnema sp. NPDC050801]|uniref:acyl-CoA dehydrogenase family protein n=1 Tax=unclassified Actinosynnema TaxID=2637065 RepID=UPI0033CBD361
MDTTARQLRARFTDLFSAWGEGHLDRDRAAAFPHEQWKSVAESGLLRQPFPVEWGGAGGGLLDTMHLLEEFGYACRDTGLGFGVSTHVVSTGVPIERFGSTELKSRYLPGICAGDLIGAHAITERQGGSDAAAMRTTAVTRDDGFVLNGEKCFISSGPVADLVVVYARTSAGSGPFGITAFAVERSTPGLEVGPPVEKMGLRTSPFCHLVFRDCAVPAANVIGRVGQGFRILDHVMAWEVLCSFAISVGSMRWRLERCVEHVRSREQFGRPIGAFQSVANKVVDMKIGLETSSRWLFETGRRFAAGEDVMVDVAIGKLLVSEANVRSAADAVQLFGARGYSTDHGLEKDLRDATGGTIYSGSSEVQRDKIARLLGVARRWDG